MEINGIKFKKGRMIVYCHDLNRIADDPDRRTFVLEPTLRAVEARMVRLTGVDVETGRDAPRPVGARGRRRPQSPRGLRAPLPDPLRPPEVQDHHRVRRLTARARACSAPVREHRGDHKSVLFLQKPPGRG